MKRPSRNKKSGPPFPETTHSLSPKITLRYVRAVFSGAYIALLEGFSQVAVKAFFRKVK
jgi:hypothetical protein